MEAFHDLVNARRDLKKAEDGLRQVLKDGGHGTRKATAARKAVKEAKAALKDAKKDHDAALKKGGKTRRGGRGTRSRKTRRCV